MPETESPLLPSSPAEVGAPTVGRFVTFLDAGVAIALTLLILPLMEGVSEFARESEHHAGTATYLSEHSDQLVSLALSFAVISVFWMVHHRTLREDTPFTVRLAQANLVWLFTIVVLPVATALVGALEVDRAQIALYVGLMAASSLSLVWVTREVRAARRSAGLPVAPRSQYAGSGATALLFLAALVLGLTVPEVNYYALFVLFLAEPLRRLVVSRMR